MDSLSKKRTNGIWMVPQTNSEPSILHWYNNPLIWLLKCYGVDIFGNNTSSANHFCWKNCSLIPLCTTVLLMFVLVLKDISSMPCAWSTENFYPIFFTILPCVIETFIAFLILLCIFIKRRRLGNLITSLGAILEANQEGKCQTAIILRRFSWVTCALLAINAIVQFAFYSYIFGVMSQLDEFKRFAKCLGFEFSCIMSALLMDIWVIVTQNLILITMGIFTYVCILITLSFRMVTAVPCTSLDFMQKRHQQLCFLVAEADAVFSSIAFLWYLQIVSACCWIRALSNPFLSNYQYYFVQLAILFVEYALSIIIISCAGNAVNEEVIRSIPETSSYNQPYPLNHEENILNEIKFMSYFVHKSNSPPALTAMGFFTIRKSLVINITGTIITYSIILFEMQQ